MLVHVKSVYVNLGQVRSGKVWLGF